MWLLPSDSLRSSVGYDCLYFSCLPQFYLHVSETRHNCSCAEQASMVCCGVLSLGCVAIAGAELFLVFYFREAGIGQRWLETIETVAGGRLKATPTGGWQFQRID